MKKVDNMEKQMDNLNREMEILKKNQQEIQEIDLLGLLSFQIPCVLIVYSVQLGVSSSPSCNFC